MNTIYVDDNNNLILCAEEGKDPRDNNCKVTFSGSNNILLCEDGVNFQDTKLSFKGSNSVIYISENKHYYKLNLTIYNNSVAFFGKNNYFNGELHVILSEEKNLVVGEDCLFSFDIWIRTADPHLIYGIDDGKRKNYSKSVFVGDHVWIGQHTMLLKGTQIGSGSIVGAMSVVAGKKIPSIIQRGREIRLDK